MHVFGLGLLITVAMVGVVWGWAVSSFPWLARRRKAVAAALAAIVVVQMTTRWAVIRFHSQIAATVQTVAIVCIMTMAIAGVPMAVMRALSWAIGRAQARQAARSAATAAAAKSADPGPMPSAKAAGAMTRRQLVEAVGGTAILGSTGVTLAWGVLRGRHEYQLREIAVPIPGLPRVLDGYAIVQVSDIHAGTYVGERELDDGLALV